MISVIIKKNYRTVLSPETIERMIFSIFQILNVDENSGLSILVTSETELHKLNRQYLDIDKPTDVLSFESNEVDPETGCLFLGDIALSYPTAEKQAVEAGHPVENEITLLLIHGILHLLGYDHDSQSEKAEMWQKQQSILSDLGVTINRISGDEDFHD